MSGWEAQRKELIETGRGAGNTANLVGRASKCTPRPSTTHAPWGHVANSSAPRSLQGSTQGMFTDTDPEQSHF